MPNDFAYLQSQLLNAAPKDIVAQVAKQVAAVLEDSSAKATEVIRDNGFVHGRVAPVTRESLTK